MGTVLFPENHQDNYKIKPHEKYKVNFSHTESYRKSAVPYYQTLLNADARDSEARDRAQQAWRMREEDEGGWVGWRRKEI